MTEATDKVYELKEDSHYVRAPAAVQVAVEPENHAIGAPTKDNAFAIRREESRPQHTNQVQTTNTGPVTFPKLDPRHTFDQFVVGPSNQFAYSACLAVANGLEKKHNPLLLCGPVGLGKTHLATAIAHNISRSGSERRLVFAPAEQFIHELIHALRHDCINDFTEGMRQVDVFILDDAHLLAGRDRLQKGFIQILDTLHAQGHQIVLTSDRAPSELSGFERHLIERFESGLIALIAPPDLETRLAILQKRAAAEEIALDAEVAKVIAENVTANVRELQGYFNRVTAIASLTGKEITPELGRECLRNIIRKKDIKIDIRTIQKEASELFHIPVADLRSKQRTQRIAFCRQVAMYLCRTLTDSSFPAIGQYFDRDHSTVIHAYKLIARRVKSDAAFRASIVKIEKHVKGGHSEMVQRSSL